MIQNKWYCAFICAYFYYTSQFCVNKLQRKYFQHRSRRVEEAKGTKFFAKVIVYNARGKIFFYIRRMNGNSICNRRIEKRERTFSRMEFRVSRIV